MTDDFWFGELNRVDLSALISRANEPAFVLNPEGSLVLANPALEELLGSQSGTLLQIGKVAPAILERPGDLKPGEVTRIVRPFGPPRGTRWIAFLYISLTDAVGQQEIGTLGIACKSDAPPQIKASNAELVSERLIRLREDQLATWGIEALPARGLAMRRAMTQLKLAIASNETVAIQGEAGTGKSTFARVIHSQTVGAKGPFLLFDCAAVPHSLQAQQLIGAESTDEKEKTEKQDDRLRFEELSLEGKAPSIPPRSMASKSTAPAANAPYLFPKTGILSLHGPGTIVLKNVGGLSVEMQDAVMQWLENRHASSKLIALSRMPFEQLATAGMITDEFFHRLTVQTIDLPLLRDRKKEIADHCAWVFQQWNKGAARPIQGVEPAALTILSEYDWPGNLRELRAVLEQAAEKATGPLIPARDLPKRIRRTSDAAEIKEPPPKLPALDKALEDVERRLITMALEQASGNKSKAADLLSISRQRLLRRLEQLGMTRTAGNGADDLSNDVTH